MEFLSVKLSTAFKISGVCLFALAAEAILSYLIFSNYAYQLAETGEYNFAEAYSSGSMGAMAKGFYAVFGITAAIGIAAPIISIITIVYKKF